MNEHGEEEDRVGEEETLDSDNPHRYLFGADPLPPQISNPLPVHIATPQTVQEPIVPLTKPEEPKTNSSKLSSPPPAPQTSHLPPSKIGQYDDRFKTTVEYVLQHLYWHDDLHEGIHAKFQLFPRFSLALGSTCPSACLKYLKRV